MRRAVNSPYRITLPYGATSAPYSPSNPHNGVDYAHAVPGVKQSVYAPESGVVQHYYDSQCGKKIWLIVGGKHKHTLCHLSAYSTANGATVKEGDKIGVTGNSGLATGIHLHHAYYPKGDGQFANIEEYLKVGYSKYLKYQDYKDDLIYIHGEAPSWTYAKWQSTYKNWLVRNFLRARAKTLQNNARAREEERNIALLEVAALKEQLKTCQDTITQQNKIIADLNSKLATCENRPLLDRIIEWIKSIINKETK